MVIGEADRMNPSFHPALYDPTTGQHETLQSPFKFNESLCLALQKDLINDEAINSIGKENCLADFSELQQWLCHTPRDTTVRVNMLRTTSQDAKTQLQQHLDRVKSNVWIVNEHPQLFDVLVIKSNDAIKPLSLHSSLKEVVVDSACGVAVLRGANIYAPGILAAPAALRAGDEVRVTVDIEGKCLRGLLKTFDGKKLFIGIGKAVVSRNEIFLPTNPSGLAVEITDSFYQCPSLGSVLSDMLFLQNLPSILCGHVLDPKPGQTVLDMCSAPGGKCTHIAMLMKNQGKIIALDKTLKKIAKLQANVDQCGITCVSAYPFDATKAFDLSLKSSEQVIESPPYAPETFDRVLLDAPCSALGQRPQFNNRTTSAQLNSYPALQQKLMKSAVMLLKKGGTLVYSTCTLTIAENEKIVHWTLDTFKDIILDHQDFHLGGYGRLGSGLTSDELQKVQRFEHPKMEKSIATRYCDEMDKENDENIGFFIAKFIKQNVT